MPHDAERIAAALAVARAYFPDYEVDHATDDPNALIIKLNGKRWSGAIFAPWSALESIDRSRVNTYVIGLCSKRLKRIPGAGT